MGNSQSHSQTQFLDDWVQLQKTAVNTGTSNVWANKNNRKLQMEEYPLFVTSQQEVKQQKKIHQFRHNHPQIVSSLYFIDETQQQFCASNYQGKIFLQRIPLTLANVGDIPFPDALHLYSQTLQGFHVLASQVQEGCFPISEQHIGINCNSIVKVWMNTLYQKNYPNRNQRITEQKMVKMILDIVDSNVDYQGVGPSLPIVSRYIYSNSKAPSQVKFNEAINIFRDYVNKFFGGKIPERMNCVDQVGGSDYLYKSWNEQANKYHSNRQIVQQPHFLDSTRGFAKTNTIPYENANNLNQSYTEFKRQEPIISTANFNTNQNLSTHPNTFLVNSNESASLIRQKQIQPKPLSVQTTIPIINYSPSGFLNINNNSSSTNFNNINSNFVGNLRPNLLNNQLLRSEQNQILIKSSVRQIEEPVRKSQIIATIPSISNNNNKTPFIEPAIKSPLVIYQPPQSYTKFQNYQNPTINFNGSRSVVVQQTKQINFPPQPQIVNLPIRRQFQQSIIQNRIVHNENNSLNQVNTVSQQQNRGLIKNIPAQMIQKTSTGFQVSKNNPTNLFNQQRIQNPVQEQQRSIYVPMPSKNITINNAQGVQLKNTPQFQIQNQVEKNNAKYTKADLNSTQPIRNQNINPQRVTSQMIVLQNKSTNNSSTSPSSYLSKKQQKSQNDRSLYSPNKSGIEDLSSSKYDNLKLDDGMSSLAFLNQLKNLKNLSTSTAVNIQKTQFISSKAQNKQKQPFYNQYYSPSDQQSYKYYSQTGLNSQNYVNKFGKSIYQNLNNEQNIEGSQSYYKGDYQNQNFNENELNNYNNDQIRYQYRYSQQKQSEDKNLNQQRRQFVSENQENIEYSNDYNTGQTVEHQYKSYFDKYANLNTSPNKGKNSIQTLTAQGNGMKNGEYESHEVQQEYKVQYDPQILADLRKLHGQK